MTPIFKQTGDSIDYTPGVDITAGDVVVQADLVGVAKLGIKAGTFGALHVSGVFDFPREADTAFSAGDEVYWDADGDPEGGTAGTGAAVDTGSGGANKFIGYAVAGVTDAATNPAVRVLMRNDVSVALGAMDTLSDVGDGDPGAGEVLVGDGDSWEARAVSGLITLGGGGAAGLPDHADAAMGLPLLIQKTYADGVTGDVAIFDGDCPRKIRIIDAWVENRGANGANANSIQVCAAEAGASAITDAMDLTSVADTGIVRAAEIDDANGTIDADGDLYLRRTKAGGTMGGNVCILAVPVA